MAFRCPAHGQDSRSSPCAGLLWNPHALCMRLWHILDSLWTKAFRLWIF
ncbi:hypothetical protein HMPREF0972_00463 [Actinomyces sp. oral taxon 848 str. F0332]|nr:hypothetical protein HMPREF0972_00463 [Actinomyces sp. oral taxon 848 str. F0332]